MVCTGPPNVYDVLLDDNLSEFQENCSLKVYWTPPSNCSHPVVRYTVQSAQGCPLNWKNFTIDGNNTYLGIEDTRLYAACLLGDCHIRVLAELNVTGSEPTYSTCIELGDFSSFFIKGRLIIVKTCILHYITYAMKSYLRSNIELYVTSVHAKQNIVQ